MTLAVGAEVKNTFCLARDDMAFCSGHLGDMGSLESQQAFGVAVAQLIALHAAEPELVVADDHPGYATHEWAERYSAEHGVPLVTVQHHHAHVASLLAEHGLLGTPRARRRLRRHRLRLRPLGLGRRAAAGRARRRERRPGSVTWSRSRSRAATARCATRSGSRSRCSTPRASPTPTDLDLATACPAEEQAVVRSQLTSGVGCVPTTSVGRLFDGVASLLGVRHEISYEAQAAIELEALARTSAEVVELDHGRRGRRAPAGPAGA